MAVAVITVKVMIAAVAVKVDIVAADPFEAGPREFLNLGHTLAHALEVSVTPRPLHGDAVSIGMVMYERKDTTRIVKKRVCGSGSILKID